MYVDTFSLTHSQAPLKNIYKFIFILLYFFIHVFSFFLLEPHLWRILSLRILFRLLFYVDFCHILKECEALADETTAK